MKSMQSDLAKRMESIRPSGIRRIFELIESMEDPINLSIGQAHFRTPEPLVEAACKALRDGHSRYTTTQGLPGLNERILGNIEERYGCRPESTLVTSGVSGGIMMAFLALLDPGDEVLLPDPNFMMYQRLAAICGAEIRYYDMYPSWGIDLAEVEEAVTEKTKIVFLNSPSNPTGGVLDREQIAGIVAAAEKVGAFIVSDEIYDSFVYDQEHVSPLSMSDRVIHLGGYSKTYFVPGWRMGYATGPAAVIDAMQTLQQFSYVCAPAPFQHAILEAAFDLDVGDYVDAYRSNRDFVVENLHPSFQVVRPGGSFYAFPSYPPGIAEPVFMEAALGRGILTVPGSAFSRRDTNFRISFAVDDVMLKRGISGLNELAEQFKE